MPAECLPLEGQKRGRLSYTITNSSTGAKVEVLLKAKAFRIVKMAPFDKDGYLEHILICIYVYGCLFPCTWKILQYNSMVIHWCYFWNKSWRTPVLGNPKQLHAEDIPFQFPASSNALGTMTSEAHGTPSRTSAGGAQDANLPAAWVSFEWWLAPYEILDISRLGSKGSFCKILANSMTPVANINSGDISILA